MDIRGTPIRQITFGAKHGGSMDAFNINQEEAEHVMVDLFPEDNIGNLKEKIFIATGIYPTDQALFYNGHIMGHSISVNELSYEIKEPQAVDRETGAVSRGLETGAGDRLFDIPIDKYIFNNHTHVTIIDLEYITLQNQDFYEDLTSEGHTTIRCYTMHAVRTIMSKDLNLGLLYWSMVKYFPYFSMDAFKDYIHGEHDRFPTLFRKAQVVATRIMAEAHYLNNIYDLLGRPDKELNKFNISLIRGVNSKSANLKFNITEMSVLIQKRGKPNLMNLFIALNTNEDVPIIVYNDRSINYTKVYYKHEKNVPLFIYKNRKVGVYIVVDNVVFEIDIDGFIFANLYPNMGEVIDFKEAERIIQRNIVPFYDLLDGLKLSIFMNTRILHYYEIIRISVNLHWFANVTNFQGFINDMVQSQLIRPKDDGGRFYWTKGVQNDLSMPTWNEFEYLVDATIITTPVNYFEIINKYSEIIINARNLTEADFKNFIKFIIYNLYNIKTETIDRSKINNLKHLHMEDPKNYDIGKMYKGKVYASFCQKPKQPMIITDEEVDQYKNKDRVLQFWNFTKEEPMWYYCPNDNFPIPGFSVGYHPDNNCLVCCRKKKNFSKNYMKVHQECLATHKFISKRESGQIRYVINFGKMLDLDRLGNLPDIINKFLVYNMEDVNIISETVSMQSFRFRGRIYNVNRLMKITKDTRVQHVPTMLFEAFISQPVWRDKRKGDRLIRPIDVLNQPELNRKYYKHYKRILKANVEDPLIVFLDQSTGKHVIIDGMHRLAFAYHKKIETVPVKFVTAKQLQRAFIGKYNINDSSFLPEAVELSTPDTAPVSSPRDTAPKVGGDDKEPFYYLMGVQYKIHDHYCSYLTSIAAALDVDIDDFVKDVIKRARATEYVGTYASEDLIDKMQTAFIKNNPIEAVNWDEIFMQVLPVLYGYVPIVLEYATASNVNLILQYKYENWTNDEFILLLHYDGIYNPVFIVIPYIYAKNKIVEKRIYNYDDQIIKIFEILVDKTQQTSEFTMSKIVELSQYKIVTTLSFGGMAFAVEIAKAEGNGKAKVYVTMDRIKTAQVKYDAIVVDEYDLALTHEFLTNYSKKYGMPVNVTRVFVREPYPGIIGPRSTVAAYEIHGMVNFLSCTLAEFQRIFGADIHVERWNYDPAEIINAKYNKEDPILSKYLDLNAKRNDYIYFKEEYFRKHKITDLDRLKPSTPFEQALIDESRHPLKRQLMTAGVYNFHRLVMKKNKNENIYVKFK